MEEEEYSKFLQICSFCGTACQILDLQWTEKCDKLLCSDCRESEINQYE